MIRQVDVGRIIKLVLFWFGIGTQSDVLYFESNMADKPPIIDNQKNPTLVVKVTHKKI